MVSIIVPVYDAEKYLDRCLNSIFQQTLEDIEIICVNDGSNDGSLDIIKKYAKKDTRICIVDKKNGGLVSARKAGVSEAKGKYIGFVDSDDWIEPEMYEKLYSHARDSNCDIVCSGYYFEGNYVSRHVDQVDFGVYDSKKMQGLRDLTVMNLGKRSVGIRASLCCKLFSRNILEKIYPQISDEITISEDKIGTLYSFLEAESVAVVDEAYYHYMKNDNSMVNSYDQQYLKHVQIVWEHFRKVYEHPHFSDSMRLQAEIYLTDMLYKGINSRMGFKKDNMLWVDPYWLKEIPDGTHVLLYGFGDFLETYKRQLQHYHNLECEGCVSMPEKAKEAEFDYLVVAIKNKAKADEEIDKLVAAGISAEKILWFPQDEVYWRFIEANGWI